MGNIMSGYIAKRKRFAKSLQMNFNMGAISSRINISGEE
jgi:hypothetical protein